MQMSQRLKAFLFQILDFFMPNHLTCHFCEVELPPHSDVPLCEVCASEFIQIEGHLCAKCGRSIDVTYAQHADYFYKCKECQEQFVYFNKHRAYTQYDKGVKTALMGLKYKKQIYQSVFLGKRLAEMVAADDSLLDFDLVIPVPVHYFRQMSRGYNQAELLAQHMCRSLGVDRPMNLLVRKRSTKKLKKLDKNSRKSMLSDAIIVNKNGYHLLKEKKVLLVDDIYTTGTTLNACAKVLYEAGCTHINCVTVARGH